MQFQIATPTVVETKFVHGQGRVVVLEIAPTVHFTIAIPYEHKVKVGDKVPLFMEIPLELGRLT